jgi:hypothetical protein
MPNCDFYAVGDDFAFILDFIFDQPGWVLVEDASRPDQPLRRFASTAEVASAFELGVTDAYLQLHAAAMGSAIIERAVTFRDGAVPGACGRTVAEGWGLIQVYLMAPADGWIRPSHTNCNSEARSRKWEPVYLDSLGPIVDWNWREVEWTSAQLNRFVRSRAVGKSGSRFVLPAAVAAVAAGAKLALNSSV